MIIKNKSRHVASLLGLVLFLILAVGSVDDSGSSDGSRSNQKSPSTPLPRPSAEKRYQPNPAHAPAPTIPADVTYSIIDSDNMFPYKRSLVVRLNKKVSEVTLRDIAIKLKGQDSRNYERTFICYLLPDMVVDAGAWATTHFNPNLDVRILGLTDEQEEFLKQQPDDPSREVIGSWLDDRPFVGNRITFFRQDGKLFMEHTFTDGKDSSSLKNEIVVKPSTGGKKFENKGENSFGEFYLIDKDGNLQIWDQDGLISTAKKIGS